MQTPTDAGKRYERWAAFAFGVLFVSVILVLAVRFEEPTAFQYTAFRIVLALAASGAGAFIPGVLHVELGRVIRAGGALAIFVVVYSFSPAPLVVKPPLDEEDVALLENYKVQCENGDPVACNTSGRMIGDAEGAARDYRLSATYYERACDLGSGMGCRNAARRYRRGKGRPKDLAKATSLYQKSCRLGYAKGCSDLARLYESNQTGSVRLDLARGYYRRACDLGELSSCQRADFLTGDNDEGEKS